MCGTSNRIPLKGGDEFDALTKSRRYYKWARGQLKKIKRGYNKRVRRTARRNTAMTMPNWPVTHVCKKCGSGFISILPLQTLCNRCK